VELVPPKFRGFGVFRGLSGSGAGFGLLKYVFGLWLGIFFFHATAFGRSICRRAA
jgi:hypothetical protein